MNLTEEKIGPCLVALQVEVEAKRVDQAMLDAAKRIAHSGSIAGFRKGKAPYHVVLRTFGKEAVLAEAVDRLGNEILQEAVVQQDLTPYNRPSLEIVNSEPLTLKFTVTTGPVVDLGAYRSIRVEPRPVEVDESEVEQALAQVRRAHATYVPVERTARVGDVLRLDLKVRSSEEALIDEADRDVELTADEEPVAPGFNAALAGAGIGELREFELSVPADYQDDKIAGKTIQVSAAVKDVKEISLPALDDELAKTVGKYDTLAEMRADLRDNLLENATRQERERYEDEIVDKALQGALVEFPDAMVDEEVRHSLTDLMRDVGRLGFSFENWLRMNGMDVGTLRASLRPQVERRLRRSLFLFNLAQREGIQVESADIDAAIEKELQEYPAEKHEEIRSHYRSEDARAAHGLRLIMRSALDKLVTIARGEGLLLPGDVEPARALRPS